LPLPTKKQEHRCMKFSLFGSPRLEIAGQMISMGRRKAIALLTYLLITGQPHSRVALATLLWPDSDRARALTALRQTLSLIKKLCGPAVLDIRRDCLRWSPESPVSVDVLDFQSCLAAVLSPLPEKAPTTARLVSAVDLYQGEFLADFVLPDAEEFETWRRQQANRLQQGLTALLPRLIQQLRHSGQQVRAIHYARRWVLLDPLHEPAQQSLLELLIEAGQRAKAVAHYEQFAWQVEAQCGLPPTFSLPALLRETAVSSPTYTQPPLPVLAPNGRDRPRPRPPGRPGRCRTYHGRAGRGTAGLLP
jgi:DNA-binding SARP family transcriptional activator